MFRQLRADEIDCRISICNQYGVGLLLYKDARCDQNILDETVGPYDWQRKHEIIDGRLYCSVGLYDHNKNEWIWKQDVGTESYTEKEKGQASDSFKRACFNWGIGRELYTAPDMWVRPENLKRFDNEKGKYTCRDTFTVEALQYEENKICYVRIINNGNKKILEFGRRSAAKSAEPAEELKRDTISPAKAAALDALCYEKNVSPETVCKRYRVSSLSDLTEEQHRKAVKALQSSSGG